MLKAFQLSDAVERSIFYSAIDKPSPVSTYRSIDFCFYNEGHVFNPHLHHVSPAEKSPMAAF